MKLHLIHALLIALIPFNAFGQEPPSQQWLVKKGTASFQEYGHGISISANGTIYVTGTTYDSGGDDDSYDMPQAVFRARDPLSHYNSDSPNQLLWVLGQNAASKCCYTLANCNSPTSQLNGSGNDIVVDDLGFSVLTGLCRFTFLPNPSSDGFVRIFDPGCRHVNEDVVGALAGDVDGIAVAMDSEGYIYVAGESVVANNHDAFLAKFSPAGTFMVSIPLTTAGDDVATGVAVDQQDNVYVTGVTTGDFAPSSNGNTKADIFLVKFNQDLVQQFRRQYGDPNLDEFACSVAVVGKGIYIGGHVGQQALLLKYLQVRAQSDNPAWERFLGGPQTDAPLATEVKCYDIAADSSGIYLTGRNNGSIESGVDPEGMERGFVAKYSARGDFFWARQVINNGMASRSVSIALAGIDQIYITGSTGNFSPPPKTTPEVARRSLTAD